MPASSAPHVASAPSATATTLGPHALIHANMVQLAGSGLSHGNNGPCFLRVVPLLYVAGEKGERIVLVGHSLVTVQDSENVALQSFVTNGWEEGPAEGEFRRLDLEAVREGDAVNKAISAFEEGLPRWPEKTSPFDQEMHAAKYAKALAELSRNAVSSVREIRYDLEHRLAQFSSKSLSTSSSTPIVASLLELSIICGRAADEAREAVREGLWLHLSDSKAYHSYRRLQDPSIINAAEPATPATRSWMRLHDAAVRQCVEMRKQLDAEAGSARNLMAAAASISNSREADAQSAFNTLAAVASLGLGIPALVLALYGADRLLPLNTQPRQLAFIPVAIGLVLAAVIAVLRAPKGKSSWIWIGAAIAIIVLLLILLVWAGLLAPDS